MNFDKTTTDYLFSIVSDEKIDIGQRIIEDLSGNINSPDVLFKLCQSSIKRADTAGYKEREHAIEFVLNISKKLMDEGNGIDGRKIKELLFSDSIISKCYYTVAEDLKYIDDMTSAEKVIRRKFELLKGDVGKNSYAHVMTVQNDKDEIIDRDAFRNPDIHDFTKLAYVYQDICGKSDTFPKDVVEFAVSSIKCEWFIEVVELGEWYAHIGDYTEAVDCFKRCEGLVKDFDDYWILCQNLWMIGDKGDRDYAMQIMLKTIHFVKDSNIDCAERYIRLAQICSNVNGICDHRLTLELLKAGQRSAENLEQLKNVQDSVQEISEQWEEEAEERKNAK
jgi:tetratricopeptide (TPR) repeat protein